MAALDQDDKGPGAPQTGELFSGKLPIARAVELLRLRLLDLSSRNRLLNYRHPRSRSIQFVDRPDINLLFDSLVDGRSVKITYVKEPLPVEYRDNKKPDVRSYAQTLGIDISYEFTEQQQVSANKRVKPLQALYYPRELERLVRRISTDARTVVEETGTNMLYLIFGFLQFYEDEISDKILLAPILALPVVLSRNEVDADSGTYQYSLEYSGEDIAENQTLREKLRQDHSIEIPTFGEEETPQEYFRRVQYTVRARHRWKVSSQLTLGFLSFGKLAIWADLNPKRWPGLFENPLLKEIFQGKAEETDQTIFEAEDYAIDQHKWGNLPLIYDADASQHSAIIDAIEGKNLVINGPPGTGKSQTITNIIATALAHRKKVLFVSEKLAALEVVRDRLEKAKLGSFCLELHSHKTQKKRLIDDLSARLNQDFGNLAVQQQLALLNRQKLALNRHAELLNSRLSNNLGKTVHQILWSAERWRQSLGDLASRLATITLADAPSWNYDELEERRVKLATVARTFQQIDGLDAKSAWTGFEPGLLAPGDDADIAVIISEALENAEIACASTSAFAQAFKGFKFTSVREFETLCDTLSELGQPSRQLRPELLPRLFPTEDPGGVSSACAMDKLRERVNSARERLSIAAKLVRLTGAVSSSTEKDLATDTEILGPPALGLRLSELQRKARIVQALADSFEEFLNRVSPRFEDFTRGSLEGLRTTLTPMASLKTSQTRIEEIQRRLADTRRISATLTSALEKVSAVARTHYVPFDGTIRSLTELLGGASILGLLPGVSVSEELLSEAAARTRGAFAHFPIGELRPKAHALKRLAADLTGALSDIRRTTRAIGFPLEESVSGIRAFGTIVKIARAAPQDLLKYRSQSYESLHMPEVIAKIAGTKALEERMRLELDEQFHLDALPSVETLKSSLRALRRRSALVWFLFSDKRAARRLYKSLIKTTPRRRIANPEEGMASLLRWAEHRSDLESNSEYGDAFGPLFEGVNTDLRKIERLATWYSQCRVWLLEHPGLITAIAPTKLDIEQIAQLAARAPKLLEEVQQVVTAKEQAARILGGAGSPELQNADLMDLTGFVASAAEQLLQNSEFFSRLARPNLSCQRAAELLGAKLEIQQATPELEHLIMGCRDLEASGGDCLTSSDDIFINWYSHLQKIRSRCAQMSALIDALEGRFSPLATPEQIQRFLEAKLDLDQSVAGLGPEGWKSGAKDWRSYLNEARKISNSAERLVTILNDVTTSDAALQDVLKAVSTKVSGERILAEAFADPGAQSLFGPLLTGVDVDLDAIGDTHAWGAKVYTAPLPSEIAKRLLGPDGPELLGFALDKLNAMRGAVRGVRRILRRLESYGRIEWNSWQSTVRSREGEDLPLEIRQRLENAERGLPGLLAWSRFLADRGQCRELGVASLVSALEQGLVPATCLDSGFNFVTYNSIARGICRSYSELASFNADVHESIRQQYMELDRKLIELNGARLAYAINDSTVVPRGTTGPRASDYSEGALLRRELNKQRRHLAIRQLIKRAGRALQALKPCFMMGPLSVAQYLEPESVRFDLVVMDEASQLRPEDALGAIARGSQLIVVGDQKQLPPTSFFDRLVDSPEDEESEDSPAITEGMESILDICHQLFHPPRALRWHYRSAHESLIAFSNHQFYDNRLIIFPSRFQRAANLGVKYRYVSNGFYQDRSNIEEAKVVVDAIVEHMIGRPDESLGVVTVNQTQRDLIFELFERKLSMIEACRVFQDKHEAEGWPFFVKNLENVQGDERDVIFISCNFGKVPGTNTVRQNFGPIGRRDGWRRLNVLFTRARLRVHLFTSMQPSDIVVDEKTPQGTKALRDYLEYARKGFVADTDTGEREPDSDFEIAVAQVLRAHGFDVKPQLGVAGYFIDLAVRHPVRRGEFVAGIECDGATYHSSRSARDRDRIRQEILERLGWRDRIYRIWSTDWFSEPARASAKLLAFVRERIASSDASYADAGNSVEPEISRQDQGATAPSGFSDGGKSETAQDFGLSASTDFFVEVGDTVSYAPVDSLETRSDIRITPGASQPSAGLVNEDAPLAKAFLGLYAGELAELKVPGQTPKMLKILKIRRNSPGADFRESDRSLAEPT